MKDNKTQGRSVADAYAAYMQKTSAKDPEKNDYRKLGSND